MDIDMDVDIADCKTLWHTPEGVCALVEDVPDLACMALLVEPLRETIRPRLRAAMRQAVVARYRQLTRPGTLDGPLIADV